MDIKLQPQYGFVLLSSSLTAFHCILSTIYVSKQRRSIFDQTFMKNNFGEIHKTSFREQISAGGFPDTGSGQYSQKLNYKDWNLFNRAQRIHLNFVEGLASSLVFQLIGGIYFPIPSAALGALYNLGRLIYGLGYWFKGSQGRIPGVIMFDLALIGSLGLSVASAIMWILKRSNN